MDFSDFGQRLRKVTAAGFHQQIEIKLLGAKAEYHGFDCRPKRFEVEVLNDTDYLPVKSPEVHPLAEGGIVGPTHAFGRRLVDEVFAERIQRIRRDGRRKIASRRQRESGGF